MRLKILGRPSNNALNKGIGEALDFTFDSNEIVFFCDFSQSKIPIGAVFNNFKDSKNRDLYIGKIVLKSVTQQFFLKFDEIPKGHKTVAKFEFPNNLDVPEIFNSVQFVESWYDSNSWYLLE